jgi:alkylhydroperoxidase family enzyme
LALGSEITDAVLADLDTAPIGEGLRATVRFVQRITEDPQAVGPADAAALLQLGVSRQQIEDALAVAFCFNLITRLADAFGWHIPDQASFDASGHSLLERGYLMPFRAKVPLEPESTTG